jgi:hypothetical protein
MPKGVRRKRQLAEARASRSLRQTGIFGAEVPDPVAIQNEILVAAAAQQRRFRAAVDRQPAEVEAAEVEAAEVEAQPAAAVPIVPDSPEPDSSTEGDDLNTSETAANTSASGTKVPEPKPVEPLTDIPSSSNLIVNIQCLNKLVRAVDCDCGGSLGVRVKNKNLGLASKD